MQNGVSLLERIKPRIQFPNLYGTGSAVNFAKYFEQRGVLLRQRYIIYTLKLKN